MLRRLPTALTISPEDIQAYEDQLTRRIAYAHYKRTGEDPEGFFTGTGAGEAERDVGREENRRERVDPNDELKPLPGDKARIVRGREERIMGGPGAGVRRG